MNIELIVQRVIQAIKEIDSTDSNHRANPRTGVFYSPGIASMSETVFTRNLVAWWSKNHPTDIDKGQSFVTELRYPRGYRGKCDVAVIDADGNALWAIEVKRIQFVGNNGKNNDFGLAKVLSPYNKDRSVVHDVNRLRSSRLAVHSAVVAYGFEYSFATCDEASQIHPNETERINNVRKVCRGENANTGEYLLDPMLEMLNDFLVSKDLTQEMLVKDFKDAWRHPCGGHGKVAGWHVNSIT